MLRRALSVFSRLLLVSGACLAALLGLAIILPVQSLPWAQITVVGKVRGRASHPVTVAVRLPGGYGLTASERRDGWAALNAEGQVDVALDGSGFAAEMPRARYCITKWMWQETPPPPAWFVLRFSDAPGEEYVVWSFGGRSGYDLPIQHIHDTILKVMGRGVTRARIESLIEDLRSNIPKLFFRTSLIVGFPGETEAHFAELLEFVNSAKFERLGAFPYSREEGTPAASFRKQIPKEVKEQRLKEIMIAQQKIALKKHKNLVGNTISVMVDEKSKKNGAWLGRTYGDAPDVDSKVIIRENRLKPGDIKNMIITGNAGYDLVGTVIHRKGAKGAKED